MGEEIDPEGSGMSLDDLDLGDQNMIGCLVVLASLQ